MDLSSIAGAARKEVEALKSFSLTVSSVLALHIGVLTSALATLNKVPKIADEPIEGKLSILRFKT